MAEDEKKMEEEKNIFGKKVEMQDNETDSTTESKEETTEMPVETTTESIEETTESIEETTESEETDIEDLNINSTTAKPVEVAILTEESTTANLDVTELEYHEVGNATSETESPLPEEQSDVVLIEEDTIDDSEDLHEFDAEHHALTGSSTSFTYDAPLLLINLIFIAIRFFTA